MIVGFPFPPRANIRVGNLWGNRTDSRLPTGHIVEVVIYTSELDSFTGNLNYYVIVKVREYQQTRIEAEDLVKNYVLVGNISHEDK